MSEQTEKLVLRTLRMAIACAALMMALQIAGAVISWVRPAQQKQCVCLPEGQP